MTLIKISRRREAPQTKAIIFSANQVSYCFAPQTKAITFSTNQVSYCFAPQTKAIIFQPIRCHTVMTSLISVHLVIPDLHHASGRRLSGVGDSPRGTTPSSSSNNITNSLPMGPGVAGAGPGPVSLRGVGPVPLQLLPSAEPWPTLA
jgi:hypothetical protein